FRDPVKFTSSDGTAVLPGPFTFTAADDGSHIFTNNITLKTAGNDTITVTDTNNGFVLGRVVVTVNAAGPNTIAATSGGGQTATVNTAFASALSVTVKDT